jgi:signal transduction histidine kinase
VFVLGATLLTQAGVAYWVYRYQRDQSGSMWFLIMVGAGVIWVLPMLLALVLSTPLFQKGAYFVGHLGVILTVGSFMIFASTYTGSGFHRSRLLQTTLFGILAVYLVLAPTNSMHSLLFEFSSRETPFSYLAITRGPAYQAMALLIQLPVFYASYRLAEHLLATQRRGGMQFALFALGALSILALENIAQWTTVVPAPGFPHATLAMFAFYVCTALALFRFRLLDAKPVARNAVIEDLQNPVLVVDGRNRVADYNVAATNIWPTLSDQTREPFGAVCPELASDVDLAQPDGESATRTTLTRRGGRRHYSVTVSPVTVGNEMTGWRSILLRDTTELRRSREQLKAQNERLNKVATTISHDLRNPINVAAGHIQMLESELDDELHEHVRKTHNAHDRMLDIIDDILTIAREGETVEQTEQVDLAAVAEEAWEHATTRAGTLTIESDRTFHADRSKLLTIFENLFRNAFDHGPDDAEVVVGATETGFYIADDGPGIPEGIHDSIFQFGYTTDDDGTGLGLAIVQTMAQSHGWTVELDTEYADGTRFVFAGVEDASKHRENTEAPA